MLLNPAPSSASTSAAHQQGVQAQFAAYCSICSSINSQTINDTTAMFRRSLSFGDRP
jgi:hypothetical protein